MKNNWLLDILKSLWTFALDIIAFIAKGTYPEVEEPVPEIPPIPPPLPPVSVPTHHIVGQADVGDHSFAWCGGTLEERRSMYALAVRICDEEVLSHDLTQKLLATVWGESGWNQWCINNKTFDYGIAQFSHSYYLPEYKMNAQEAIDNPEKCLRIMARNFKAGRASNWVAYSSGGYKNYLGKTL